MTVGVTCKTVAHSGSAEDDDCGCDDHEDDDHDELIMICCCSVLCIEHCLAMAIELLMLAWIPWDECSACFECVVDFTFE